MNLMQNGSFVDTSRNYMALSAGATAIAGWTVSPSTSGAIVWGKTQTVDAHAAPESSSST